MRLGMHYAPHTFAEMLSLEQVFMYYPYFLLANMIKRNQLQEYLFDNSMIFWCALLIWSFNSYIIFPMSNYVVATAAICVIMNIIRKFDTPSENAHPNTVIKLLHYLGRATLYIYVFHYFALQFMKCSFITEWLVANSNIMLDFVLCIVPAFVAIIFSLLVKYVIDREPFVLSIIFNK